MTALWLVATLCAGMLLYGAARGAEMVASLRAGRPRRVVWLVAMLYLSVLSAAWLLPRTMHSSATTVEWIVRTVAAPATGITVTDQSLFSALSRLNAVADHLVALYVIGASLVVGVILATVYGRHILARAHWEEAELQGVSVLLSENVGPALSGVFRPRIVLPRWVFDIDTAAQRAILLHEVEHRRAGDHRLHAVAALLLVVNAWNPMMWLYCRRLLRAVELDCDERVVSRGIAPAEYAGVLLDAYQRTHRWSAWLPSPALAERASGLGGRVENLFRPQARNITMKTIAGASLVIALTTLTAFAPSPQALRTSTPPTPETVQQMKETLKTLVAAQEAYYADHGSYTTDVAALSAAIKKPFNTDSVWVRVSFAGGAGWTGIAQAHGLKNTRCVVYIGDPAELPKLPKTFGQQTPAGEGAITCDTP